ncbi:unnamed protein product [Camellia sinensis]
MQYNQTAKNFLRIFPLDIPLNQTGKHFPLDIPFQDFSVPKRRTSSGGRMAAKQLKSMEVKRIDGAKGFKVAAATAGDSILLGIYNKQHQKQNTTHNTINV